MKQTKATRTRSSKQRNPTALGAIPSDASAHDKQETHAPAAEPGLEVMVAEAAYYRAEKRGFEPGHELEDWLAAESEIARMCSLQPQASTTSELH